MAFIKFYRGSKARYNEITHQDGVYFALDTKEIIVNGNSFGYNAEDHKEVESVEYTEPNTLTITYTNGESDIVTIPVAEAGEDAAQSKAGLISAEDIFKLSKIEEGAQVNIIETVKVNGKEITPDGKEINIDLSDVDDSIAKNKVVAGDNSVEVTEGTGTGENVEPTKIAVKIKNGGSLNVTDEGLEVDQAALTKYSGDSEAIEVGEANEDNEKTISLKLSSQNGNILTATSEGLFSTVRLKKLDVGEDDTTVASRYGLVGLQPDGTEINVGDVTIDILKDKFLSSVELGQIPEGQPGSGDDALIFTFNLADGTESVKYVNVSTFLREAEAGNGIEFTTGADGVKRYTIKIDTAQNEKDSASVPYLQVGENGLALVGINAAIAKAKTNVEEKTEGHVLVEVTTEADGKQKVVISEDDIASAEALAELAKKVDNLTKEVDLKDEWAEPDDENWDGSEDEDWAEPDSGDWDEPD